MLYVGIILGILILLLLVALVRTLLTPDKRSAYVADEPEEVSLPLAEKLSKMVQVDTTSFEGQNDPARWEAFHQVLKDLFPLVHEKLEVTDIDGNLLYYWQGKSREKPILLLPGRRRLVYDRTAESHDREENHHGRHEVRE